MTILNPNKAALAGWKTAIFKLISKYTLAWIHLSYLFLMMPLFKDFACEIAQTGVQHWCEYPPCSAIDTSYWPMDDINLCHQDLTHVANQTQSCALSLLRECYVCQGSTTIPEHKSFDGWALLYAVCMFCNALLCAVSITTGSRTISGLGLVQQLYLEAAFINDKARDDEATDKSRDIFSLPRKHTPKMLEMHQKMLTQVLEGGRAKSDDKGPALCLAPPIWLCNITQHNFHTHSMNVAAAEPRHLFEVTPFSIGSSASGYNRVDESCSAFSMGTVVALSGAATSSNLGVFADKSAVVQVVSLCMAPVCSLCRNAGRTKPDLFAWARDRTIHAYDKRQQETLGCFLLLINDGLILCP